MLNQRLTAAQRVRDALIPSEERQTEALRGSLTTMSAMLDVIDLKGVDMLTGLDAFDKVATAIAASATARRTLFEAHAALAPIPAELGLPPHAWGDDGEKCRQYFVGATTPLTVVGAAG